MVYVEGKISYRKYTDKNGVERTTTDITASTFRILGKKEGGGSGNSNFPSQEPASPYTGQVSQKEPVFEVVTPSSDAPAPDDDLPF